MQQQESTRLSTVSQGPATTRSLLTNSSRSLGGAIPTVHQTADWKRTLTVLPSLPGHPPPVSEPKSGSHQLDPVCVIRTRQADSGAAKAGAELCFVHLCM